MDDLLQTIVPLQARVTDPVEAWDLFTATAMMVRHMNEPDQRSLILRAIERSGIIFGYPTWERKYIDGGGIVISSSKDDADFSTPQPNALIGSSEDLDRQAAAAVLTADRKLSVESNVYRKPSADTRQMVEIQMLDLQILVKPKHSSLPKSTLSKRTKRNRLNWPIRESARSRKKKISELRKQNTQKQFKIQHAC